MIDGSVRSTESDTISLAGEPRTRRRRLSLVWDNTYNPEAREESLRFPVQVRLSGRCQVDEVVEEPVLFP